MLLSCTREEAKDAPNASSPKIIEFSAEMPATKAIFGEKTEDGKYPVTWTENDAAPAITYNNVQTIYQANDFKLNDDKTSHFTWAIPEKADSYYFNIVSPFSALKTFYNGNRINVEIPSGQTCTANSPDENAIILYSRTNEYDAAELPAHLTMNFEHVPAYMRLIFTKLDKGDPSEIVQAVVIESEDLNIAGRIYFFTDTKTWGENAGAMVKAVTVSTSQLDNVWVALAPVDLSGKILSFIVTTDKNTYTKEVTFPENRALRSGRTAKFTVDMTGAVVAEIVEYELVTPTSDLHYGDELIIAAADSDVAISTSQKADNRSATGITRDGTTIIGASSAVEKFTLGDGLIPGTWSLTATGGESDGYIYAADGYNENNKNWLRTKSTLDALGSWSISFGDITTNDKNSPDATRAIIRANTGGERHCLLRYNSDSNIFSAYNTGTTMNPVKIYRKVQDPVETTRFNVLDASGSLAPVEIDYIAHTIPVYIMGNVSWTATVTGGATFTSNSSTSTNGSGAAILNLDIPRNVNDENNEYELTVSTEESVTIKKYFYTITQEPQFLPVKWNFPAPSETWISGTDFNASTSSETYVYADTPTHAGKLTVVRPSGKTPSASDYAEMDNWGLGASAYLLNTNGMYPDDYWLFDVYNVDNDAGTYTIKYYHRASPAGPKYYMLEYSTDDGENWTAFETQSTLDTRDAGGSVTNSYYITDANTVATVNASFTLDSPFSGTLKIRSRVCANLRVDTSISNAIGGGGTNRMSTISITFKPDSE